MRSIGPARAGPFWESSRVKLNVFEGARRIALALGALWVVGCIAYAVFAEPYASATFAIPGPGEAHVKAERCADDDATAYTTTKTSKGQSVGILLCFTARKAADGRLLVPYSTITRVPDGSPAGIYVEGIPSSMSRAEVMAKLKESGYEAGNVDAAEMTLPMKAQLQFAPPDGKEAPLWGHYLKLDVKYSSEVSEYTRKAADRFTVGASDMEGLEKLCSQALFDQWKSSLQVLFGGLAFGWVLMATTGWIIRGFLGLPRGQDARPDAKATPQEASSGTPDPR